MKEPWTEPSTGIEFIWVPGGVFLMGDLFREGRNDEQPVHEVELSGYWIGKYPVTGDQWSLLSGEANNVIDLDSSLPEKIEDTNIEFSEKVIDSLRNQRVKHYQPRVEEYLSRVASGKNILAAIARDIGPIDYQSLKVANSRVSKAGKGNMQSGISWFEAHDYAVGLSKISGLNIRLPTEAEWEYAARSGGKIEKFPGGHNPDHILWNPPGKGILRSSIPVGLMNPNGLGLHDMGNGSSEWISDWYAKDYYKRSPTDSPKGPSTGACKIVRGGGRNLRCASREFKGPKYQGFGLRLVMEK